MTVEVFLGIVVVALCAHRAARAITTDTITDRPRAWVYEHAFHHPALEPVEPFDWSRAAEVEAGIIPPPEERIAPEAQTISRLWAYAYGFLSCGHCCGFWVSLVTWGLWWNWAGTHVWIAAGAVAGLQSSLFAKAA